MKKLKYINEFYSTVIWMNKTQCERLLEKAGKKDFPRIDSMDKKIIFRKETIELQMKEIDGNREMMFLAYSFYVMEDDLYELYP